MPEEAERLLQRCKRFDLLNKLYQDSGQWDKALEVAENGDRIHLRSSFYNFAKHLESKNDIPGAIQNYERSGTHRFEVPRLLFEDWNVLETYVQVRESYQEIHLQCLKSKEQVWFFRHSCFFQMCLKSELFC